MAVRISIAALGGLAVCAAGFVSGAAVAGDEARVAKAFPGARALKIEHFTGVIEIAVAPGNLSLVVTDGDEPRQIDIAEKGGVLRIAGEPRGPGFRIEHELKGYKGRGDDALAAYLEGYPSLKITAPEGAEVTLYDAIAIAIAGDGLGHVKIAKGYLDAAVGDVGSADIAVDRAGRVTLGAVDGDLVAEISGSGDIDAVSAGSARLAISGSGDIALGDVAGPASIAISGSGDVEAGDVAGALDVSISGSGDVDVGRVAAGASASIAGSGDISIASVNGPTRAKIAGAGDIDIVEGRAENLTVSIAGSGAFDFGGEATNLDASVLGGGAIRVRSNTGDLQTSGFGGEIEVNGKVIKPGKTR